MTRIKICGIRREEDIRYVNELRPDYIGFIFASGRKRYIEPSQAKILKNMLHPEIQAVGVFVNESPEKILSVANDGIIDIIQLHGTESDDTVAYLKEKSGKPVIKAFRIEKSEDVLNAAASCADYILLDNGIGGTGEVFNWDLIKNVGREFFLAGGLTAENIDEAISKCNPYTVDISSGVETDGVKDYNKIKEFIKKCKMQN